MKTKFRFLFASVMLFVITSVSYVSAQESKQWSFDPFTKIELDKTYKVYISQGDSHSINIESSNNAADKIKGYVEEGTLKFKVQKMVDFSQTSIYIQLEELEGLSTEGTVTVIGKTLFEGDYLELDAEEASKIILEVDYDKITTDISGAATVVLSGSADKHVAEVSGAGDLMAKDLITDYTVIEASGAATAQVSAEEELSQEISGAASVNASENASGYNKHGISVSEDGDKTKVKVGELEIEVNDNDGDTQIRLGDSELKVDEDGNVDVKRKKKKSKFNGHWAGFELGINSYMDVNKEFNMPEGYGFMKPNPLEKSVSVNLNIFEKNINLIQNKVGLVTGVGFTWNNYRFTNVKLQATDSSIMNTWAGDQEGMTKSKLTSSWVTVPLILEIQSNRKNNLNSVHIAGGMQFAYRMGSHSKIIVNGEKIKEKSAFNMNPYRLEAVARVGWGRVNLFATYSLNTLFKDDKGPELYPVSVGITILDF